MTGKSLDQPTYIAFCQTHPATMQHLAAAVECPLPPIADFQRASSFGGMLSQSEIERRLPVWHALSDIFLDTELQPNDYQWIAGVLASSGYPEVELRSIFENEVAPAFIVNLFSVAGEWAGWSEDEVRQIMLRSLERRFFLLLWMRKHLARRIVAEEWRKIAPMLAE